MKWYSSYLNQIGDSILAAGSQDGITRLRQQPVPHDVGAAAHFHHQQGVMFDKWQEGAKMRRLAEIPAL